MYTTIGIFYGSLIFIILMIFLKRHEVKSGHPTIISRLGRGSDHIFHAIFYAVRTALSYVNKHTFVALGHWVAFHILVHIRKIYVEIKAYFIALPQGKKMLDAVRGRGEIKNHGASFYLRRIADK
jgi:hypothetical protein